MDDLVTWLRAQLDEDERGATLASAALGGHGSFDPSGRRSWHDVDGMCTEEFEHIARHDPARVLREVEAKRQIVDDLARYASDTEAWEAGSPDTDGLAIRTLALLALPYADRPGYRGEWKP